MSLYAFFFLSWMLTCNITCTSGAKEIGYVIC